MFYENILIRIKKFTYKIKKIYFCAGKGIRSLSEKRRLRKSETSSVVSGPPILSKSIPVFT